MRFIFCAIMILKELDYIRYVSVAGNRVLQKLSEYEKIVTYKIGSCNMIIEFIMFYQVKWYKGSHEFYRYSPREEAKLFLVENLDVDVSKNIDCFFFKVILLSYTNYSHLFPIIKFYFLA